MTNWSTAGIFTVFTFGAAIFYFLLLIERRIWRFAFRPGGSAPDDGDHILFVDRMLRHMVPVLPPSNGVVILVGVPLLIWQAYVLDWSFGALAVLVFYLAVLLWTVTGGGVVQAVAALKAIKETSSVEDRWRVVRQLTRAHLAGFINTAGVVALQYWLVLTNSSGGGS